MAANYRKPTRFPPLRKVIGTTVDELCSTVIRRKWQQ